jgi:hypothetical protein
VNRARYHLLLLLLMNSLFLTLLAIRAATYIITAFHKNFVLVSVPVTVRINPVQKIKRLPVHLNFTGIQ